MKNLACLFLATFLQVQFDLSKVHRDFEISSFFPVIFGFYSKTITIAANCSDYPQDKVKVQKVLLDLMPFSYFWYSTSIRLDSVDKLDCRGLKFDITRAYTRAQF